MLMIFQMFNMEIRETNVIMFIVTLSDWMFPGSGHQMKNINFYSRSFSSGFWYIFLKAQAQLS